MKRRNKEKCKRKERKEKEQRIKNKLLGIKNKDEKKIKPKKGKITTEMNKMKDKTHPSWKK
jgi:hypothetical protein